MATPAKKILPNVFPRTEVEKFVRGWWRDQTEARLRRGNPFADANAKNGTVFCIQPELTSHEAVAILTRLKELLGFEPSKSVIKKGGYNGLEDFVSDLLPRLEKQFTNKQ
jgi:hypothetical protein